MQFDLAGQYKSGVSLVKDDVSTSQNGTGVDFGDCAEEISVVFAYGTNPGDDTTIDVKLQESDTQGGTYTDITGATMTQVDGDTENGVEVKTFLGRAKKWVRAVATVAGTSPAIGNLTVVLLAPKTSY